MADPGTYGMVVEKCRRCGGKMVEDNHFVFVDTRPGQDATPRKISLQCEDCGCIEPFGNV